MVKLPATIAGGHHTLPSTKQLTTRMASSGRNIPAKAFRHVFHSELGWAMDGSKGPVLNLIS